MGLKKCKETYLKNQGGELLGRNLRLISVLQTHVHTCITMHNTQTHTYTRCSNVLICTRTTQEMMINYTFLQIIEGFWMLYHEEIINFKKTDTFNIICMWIQSLRVLKCHITSIMSTTVCSEERPSVSWSLSEKILLHWAAGNIEATSQSTKNKGQGSTQL